MKKNVLALSLALALGLGLTACSSSNGGSASNSGSNTDTSGSQSSTSGSNTGAEKLVLGTSADYPPFEFHVLQDGEDKIVGIDVFLAQQIAEDMGAELETSDMDFDMLLNLMNKGDVDMVIAAMQEIQVEGLTGTMTWDATGSVTKTPTAVVIKDGAYVSAE